jgi:hypothetical protein
MNSLILAASDLNLGGGEGLIHNLFVILVIGLVLGALYAGGWYFFRKSPPFPPLAMMLWNGLFAIVILILVINFLLSLIGKGFIKL